MKYLRVGIAIVLTLVMLYVARTNSKGRPERYTRTINDVVFDITTVPKALEHEKASITLIVGVGDATPVPSEEETHRVLFRTSTSPDVPLDSYTSTPMVPSENWVSDLGREYWTEITAGPKGGKFWYYFEVVDERGTLMSRFTLDDNEPFLFKYIGEVPPAVLLLHIAFIFATVFCISMTAVAAVNTLRFGASVRPMMFWLLLATITCFIGMIPFGIPMNWYAFDATWEGVPFGHDATDNKTQLLFVYLLFATLCGWGSLRNNDRRSVCSPRGIARLGLGSFAVMLFIYLIPHSIQFSPGFTYAFCWSWIGIIVVAYLVARLKSARQT